MAVKLGDMSTYENANIPDEHVEICLKVLRTLRNLALNPATFNAEVSVLFSHTHKAIYEMVEIAEEEESAKG